MDIISVNFLLIYKNNSASIKQVFYGLYGETVGFGSFTPAGP